MKRINFKASEKRIHFVRHGQSEANVDISHYSKVADHMIELTDLGRAQAVAAGNQLFKLINGRPVTIVHSPFKRAVDTTDLIDQMFILNGQYPTVKSSPLLYERQYGGLREIIENLEMNPTVHMNYFYKPNGGESFADAYNRVCMFMMWVEAGRYKTDDIIVVGHGEWIALACMYMREQSVADFEENHVIPDNCQIITEILN